MSFKRYLIVMNDIKRIVYLLNYNFFLTEQENKKLFLLEQKKEVDYSTGTGTFYGTYGYDKGGKTSLTDMNLDLDTHDVLTWTSFAANFFGLPGFILSLGLDFINAKMYWDEGEKAEAGLQLAFSVIPGGELAARIPVVKKYGKKFFQNILLKSTKGKVISKTEREAWDELMKNQKWIKGEATKKIYRESLKQIFRNYRLVDIVKFVWLFSKKYPTTYTILKFGLTFGGVYYSWEKLAKIFGLENKSERNAKLMDYLEKEYQKNPEKVVDSTINNLQSTFMSVPENVRDSIAMSYWEINDEIKK